MNSCSTIEDQVIKSFIGYAEKYKKRPCLYFSLFGKAEEEVKRILNESDNS